MVLPDDDMIRRKKAMSDTIKFELRSKLLPTISYPTGCAENYNDYWAANYFEDRADFVQNTKQQLSKLGLH